MQSQCDVGGRRPSCSARQGIAGVGLPCRPPNHDRRHPWGPQRPISTAGGRKPAQQSSGRALLPRRIKSFAAFPCAHLAVRRAVVVDRRMTGTPSSRLIALAASHVKPCRPDRSTALISAGTLRWSDHAHVGCARWSSAGLTNFPSQASGQRLYVRTGSSLPQDPRGNPHLPFRNLLPSNLS
jgi:hypothetical protein